jgi:hypothetical protein
VAEAPMAEAARAMDAESFMVAGSGSSWGCGTTAAAASHAN